MKDTWCGRQTGLRCAESFETGLHHIGLPPAFLSKAEMLFPKPLCLNSSKHTQNRPF